MLYLIDQLIIFKFSMAEENFLNKNFTKGVWDFYCAYNLSLAYLGIKDNNKDFKNKLFRNMILKGVNEKIFNKFKNLMEKDQEIILRCLSKINENKKIEGIDVSEITYEGRVGVIY